MLKQDFIAKVQRAAALESPKEALRMARTVLAALRGARARGERGARARGGPPRR